MLKKIKSQIKVGDSMFYTVAEIAVLTGLSKVSIYNKLKLKELKPFIVKKKGITYLTEDGLKLINEGINSFTDEMEIDTEEPYEMAENEDFKDFKDIKDDYINYLKTENERLWAELQERNNQISKLSQLVENGQVLLREKPLQDIQLLKEHFGQTDQKIIHVRERMQSKQEDHEMEHKSFWSKLFGNKKRDY